MLWRRILASLYDGLILVSVLMFATLIILLIRGGEKFTPQHLGFLTYLFTISFLLYGWCWTRSGQTLGMLVWKIKVVRKDGQLINWLDAIKRFSVCLTLLGCSLLWCLTNSKRNSLHDILTDTYLIKVN